MNQQQPHTQLIPAGVPRPAKLAGSERLLGLDALRGIAAISIMLYHYWLDFKIAPLPASTMSMLGLYGVSIFFIISGAVIWRKYAAIERFDRHEAITFLIKRWFRIAPLVILATLVGYAGYLASYLVNGQTGYQIFHDPVRLFMIVTFGNALDYSPRYASLITGGWSLQVEFSFYLLVCALLLIIPRSYRIVTVAGLLAFGLYYRLAVFPHLPAQTAWTNYVHFWSQLMFFPLGILAIEAYDQGWVRYPLAIAAAALLLVGLVDVQAPVAGFTNAYAGPASTVFYGGLAVLMVFAMAAIRLPRPFVWPASFIGDISYAVYVCHPLVYGLYTLARGPKSLVGYLMCIAVTIIASAFVYHWVERPFIRVGARVAARANGMEPRRAQSPSVQGPEHV
jgi:exopolysaccharide production protein ExoZ